MVYESRIAGDCCACGISTYNALALTCAPRSGVSGAAPLCGQLLAAFRSRHLHPERFKQAYEFFRGEIERDLSGRRRRSSEEVG